MHYYPQGGESGSDTSSAMQLLRNRSTRSLWDTNYVDASWINDVVKLIPRLKGWVSKYYPGTKTGITEYNWGAESHINGATAQADILGILGREGLDLATRWTTPATGSPAYQAIKIYRNYDGSRSSFGDVSVQATVPNPDNVSAFAAQRSSDNALTVMVINKQLSNGADLALKLTNFQTRGSAQAWQFAAGGSISRLADVSIAGSTLAASVPPQSITLFVVPAVAVAAPPILQPGKVSSTNTFDLWVTGQAGQSYVLQSTTNLLNWSAIQTNTLTSNSWHVILPVSTGRSIFYRARQ